MEYITDFAAPIFSTGLADYGSQESAFVTPFVGMAIGGVGLSHVPTKVALLVPAAAVANGYGSAAAHGQQQHPKVTGDVSVVKDLVRKQV